MIQFEKKIGLPRRVLGSVARIAGITAFLTVGAAGVASAQGYVSADNVTDPGYVTTNVGSWSPTRVMAGVVDQRTAGNNNAAVGANSITAVVSNQLGADALAARKVRAADEAVRILKSAPVGGLSQNGYTAAIYLDTTVTFGAATLDTDNVNKIIVDGSVTDPSQFAAPDNSAIFADNSVAAFNAQSLDWVNPLDNTSNAVAMRGDGATVGEIGSNSALYVANALVRQDITVMENFDSITGAGAWDNNLVFSNRMFDKNSSAEVVVDPVTGSESLVVRTELDSAANTFTGISGAGASMADGLYYSSLNNTTWDSTGVTGTNNAGILYVSRATDQMYGDRGGNSTNSAKLMEGAGQLGSIAGVQFTSFDISQNFANLMLGRTNTDCPSCLEPGSFNLWATPYFNFLKMDGFKVGSFESKVDSKYGGAVIGGEYTATENFRLGLAFTVGSGDTETKGTFQKAESDFDFWGVGLYGTYSQERLSVTGDLGYTSSSHDLKQRLDSSMGMGNLKGDVDLSAFTVGLVSQYCLTDTDSNLDIVPHVGIRYTSLKTDSYNVNSRGFGRVSRVNSERQNIWTFPIGVTFTGNVDTGNGWTIKPMADLGVIFAAGDTEADSKARIYNTNIGGNFHADVVDDITFNGIFGLGAISESGFKARLDYNLKASENLTSHGISATVGYEW